VLAEGLAVIGRDDHRGLFRQAELTEGREHAPHLVIRVGDLGIVARALARPALGEVRVLDVGVVRIDEMRPGEEATLLGMSPQ
jgi:hypothetical protein